MYAVIRHYEGVDRETANDVATISHARFRERLRERPGFVAYELVIGDSGITAISVFENWVVAEETSSLARQWNQEEIAEFALPAPMVISGEIHTTPELPAPFAPARGPKVKRSMENPVDARQP
jgi:hypothetical protein